MEQSVHLYVEQKETLDASPGNESVANLMKKSSALFLTSPACGNSKVSAMLEAVVQKIQREAFKTIKTFPSELQRPPRIVKLSC